MLHEDPSIIISYVIVLFFGIGIHEYAHCKFADLAGDPTPRYYGRVTLNLTKHFEPMGTIAMILSAMAGVGIGWGRPAPMDPKKMKNPRWDFFIAIAAGPISNICQAAVYAFFARLVLAHPMITGSRDAFELVMTFLEIGIGTNITLFLFNLIPFGPLDGHWLLGLLMPEKPRHYWFQFNRKIGFQGLFGVIVLLWFLHISPFQRPVQALETLFIGQQLG